MASSSTNTASKRIDTVIAIFGPTGTGKTELGISIATRLGTEIISVDSLQCYKDGNIITAAPTAEERALVKHHMVGYLPPDAEPGQDFLLQAIEVAERLLDEGKMPVLVGGSTTLMLPLLFVTTHCSESESATKSSSDDAVGSDLQTLRWRTLLIIVTAKTPQSLERRLDARLDAMFAMGLMKELQDLYSLQKKLLPQQDGARITSGVWKCIGYKELYPFLVAEEMKARITRSTSVKLLENGKRQDEENTERTAPPLRLSPSRALPLGLTVRSKRPGNENGKRPMEEEEEEEAEENKIQKLLKDGIDQMRHRTRHYAQWQMIWAERFLVPQFQVMGRLMHWFVIPCNMNEGFKERWVETVEAPALRLCESWRAAAIALANVPAPPPGARPVPSPADENTDNENEQPDGDSDPDVISYLHDSFLSAGPPADGPPADGPPADGPPADGPPADGPPAEGPPADGPPAEGQPAE